MLIKLKNKQKQNWEHWNANVGIVRGLYTLMAMNVKENLAF